MNIVRTSQIRIPYIYLFDICSVRSVLYEVIKNRGYIYDKSAVSPLLVLCDLYFMAFTPLFLIIGLITKTRL